MKTISHTTTPTGNISTVSIDGEPVARFFGKDARRNAETFAALNPEAIADLIGVCEEVSKLNRATKDFNPGIGAGKLNTLIDSASAALSALKGGVK